MIMKTAIPVLLMQVAAASADFIDIQRKPLLPNPSNITVANVCLAEGAVEKVNDNGVWLPDVNNITAYAAKFNGSHTMVQSYLTTIVNLTAAEEKYSRLLSLPLSLHLATTAGCSATPALHRLLPASQILTDLEWTRRIGLDFA